MAKTKTCLWFKDDAEAAARFYVSLLPDSRVEQVQRAPGDYPAGKTGDVLVVEFTLGGTSFQLLNGGTQADYGNTASISVSCADQAEVDRLWAALTADGGSELACGWLRDRWGVPWQIVPQVLPRVMAGPDAAAAARVFAAMQEMVKLDVAALERAAKG